METVVADEKIKEAVREAYGRVARRYTDDVEVDRSDRGGCCGPSESSSDVTSRAAKAGCCGPGESTGDVTLEAPEASCCGPSEEIAESAGYGDSLYAAEELVDLPDSVTEASLGCGNPTAIAGLRPGEVVLDLGSGGGIDCFLAARKVGPEGRVIGLDMTPDMIKLARRNAKKVGATNVDFRYGEMEDIPLQDGSVDVIISNCVINLSPDKDAVFREAFRVLRPGGRISVSDIVIDGRLPQSIRGRLDAWAGCIAGALDESDYLGKMRAAGFEDVEVLSRQFSKISASWDEEAQGSRDGDLPQDLDHVVASVTVTAYKPVLGD